MIIREALILYWAEFIENTKVKRASLYYSMMISVDWQKVYRKTLLSKIYQKIPFAYFSIFYVLDSLIITKFYLAILAHLCLRKIIVTKRILSDSVVMMNDNIVLFESIFFHPARINFDSLKLLCTFKEKIRKKPW